VFFIFCWRCISLKILDFFMYLFISCLYMFRASQRSSGDRIVLIHHLVWLVCVSDCFVCRSGVFPPDRHTKQSLTQTNHTRWCINTIFHVFIYFMSLHVSSVTAFIIRRSNCINTSSGMISLCKWLLCMPVRSFPSWSAYQAVTYTD